MMSDSKNGKKKEVNFPEVPLKENPAATPVNGIQAKTAIKAIRAKCLDCSGGSSKEVRLCPVTDCPLYPYRFGKRPETVRKRLRGS